MVYVVIEVVEVNLVRDDILAGLTKLQSDLQVSCHRDSSRVIAQVVSSSRRWNGSLERHLHSHSSLKLLWEARLW